MNATKTLIVAILGGIQIMALAKAEPSLIVVCLGGSVHGSRTQLRQDSHTIEEDRVTLSPMVYSFDVPEPGLVRVQYGKQEIIGRKINEYSTYKTVSYQLGGASYMDTVFPKAGRVLSTEHKDSSGAPVATTWRIECKVE